MKNTNKLVSAAVTLSFLMGGGLAGLAAQVDEGIDRQATFELKPSDGTTAPEIEEPIGGETGNTGQLTLDAVSAFNFGDSTVDNPNKTNKAIVIDGGKLGLQITDARGTGQGWVVKASMTEFKSEDKTLKGAELFIPSGTVVTTGIDETASPETFAVTLNGSPIKVMNAKKDKGLGTWTNLFEGNGENVSLTVPSGNHVGQYKADITWTLEDAPVTEV